MSTVNIKINGYDYTMKKGITILDASFETLKMQREFMQQSIPTLYYLKGVQDVDQSGVCIAEVDGEIVNASVTRIKDGMEIQTHTPAIMEARKKALAEILEKHNKSCLYCFRSTSCELQDLLKEYGFTDEPDLPKTNLEQLDLSSKVLIRDNNKCIKCKRCINVCAKMQAVSAIACTGDGLDAKIEPASPAGLAAASCVNCGQCVAVCPVGALTEKTQMDQVKEALEDPDKYVVVQVAPAVRAALGEAFEFPIGVDVEGRMAEALRRLGFDKVFDTKFGADLTIMEESNELIERLNNDGELPLITSCCPGWIKYAEHFYPDMLENISSCKSPHQMQGAIVKTYLANQEHIAKENIVMVSVMPCTAKKFEITREDECGAGVPDVDIVITTNELAKMLKDAEIQLEAMNPNAKFDLPLGFGCYLWCHRWCYGSSTENCSGKTDRKRYCFRIYRCAWHEWNQRGIRGRKWNNCKSSCCIRSGKCKPAADSYQKWYSRLSVCGSNGLPGWLCKRWRTAASECCNQSAE